MEYAILDIWLLECVFKWSVSRPISGSSESILARYVCQVVSKYTKLDSHGAECKRESKVIGQREKAEAYLIFVIFTTGQKFGWLFSRKNA